MERNKRSLLIDILAGAGAAVVVFFFMTLSRIESPWIWIVPSLLFLVALVTSSYRFRKRARVKM